MGICVHYIYKMGLVYCTELDLLQISLFRTIKDRCRVYVGLNILVPHL